MTSRNNRRTHSSPARTSTKPPPPDQPGNPSLFKQMATTAAGVAVGSAVGHAVADTVGSAIRSKSDANATEEIDPCSLETDQFLKCARSQTNLSNCEKLSEAFKQCTAKQQKPK